MPAKKSLVTRLGDAAFGRFRHAEAHDTATDEPVTGFGHLRGHKYANVVTYRKDGTPVPSPVWFGMDEAGRLYFVSEASAPKVARIRNNPRVRVAPCDVRGKPLGPPALGTARVLTDAAEIDRAEAARAANYGLGYRINEAAASVAGPARAYVEVVPS